MRVPRDDPLATPRTPMSQTSKITNDTLVSPLEVLAAAATAKHAANELRKSSPRPPTPVNVLNRIRSHDSAGFMAGSVHQRGHSDPQFLTSIKQALDAQREHLHTELGKMQKESKLLNEANLNRYEERQRLLDGRHTKLDRRQAELTGTLQGLSEELQGQVRRVDLMEERMRVWRQQVEEEVRSKLSDSLQHFQKSAADMRVARVALEDTQKKQDHRILRLEADTTEAEALLSLHQRVENVEVRVAELPAKVFRDMPRGEAGLTSSETVDAHSATLSVLQQHVEELLGKMQSTTQQQHEVEARLVHHEERVKALRSSVEAKDEWYRQLGSRLDRATTEPRAHTVSTELATHPDHMLQLEDLLRRVQNQEEAHAELHRALPAMSEAENDCLSAAAAVVMNQSARLDQLESRIDEQHAEMCSRRHDEELAPRLGQLVGGLENVTPIIMKQEDAIRQLMAQQKDHEAQAEALHESMREVTAKVASVPLGTAHSATEKQRLEDLRDEIHSVTENVRSEFKLHIGRATHDQSEKDAEETARQIDLLAHELRDGLQLLCDDIKVVRRDVDRNHHTVMSLVSQDKLENSMQSTWSGVSGPLPRSLATLDVSPVRSLV
uniref:Uncharacterized protein n=1 Tax=Noctiluca scintillans TaxID=2966 RepID=A0A7S0ZP22_NOCSC